MSQNAQDLTARPGPDRTGEMRYQLISQFERSNFPAIIAGPSRLLDVERNGRWFTVERAMVISRRTRLDGTPYKAYTDENLDFRFMPPRDEAIVGFDATENGEKITLNDHLREIAEDFQAYLKSQQAPIDEAALDSLPL